MFDWLPPDLLRLRTLETWYATVLHHVREAITVAEAREREQARRQERRPPAPEWLLTRSIDTARTPTEVHTGDCRMAGKHTRAISRAQAVDALTQGLRACVHCRPDTVLGIDT